jgi:hypothetical protein
VEPTVGGKVRVAHVLCRSLLDTGGALGAPKKIDLMRREKRAEGRLAQSAAAGVGLRRTIG